MNSSEQRILKSLTRRSFLNKMITGTSAAVGSYLVSNGAHAVNLDQTSLSGLPKIMRNVPETEEYWSAVKAMFPLRKGLILLNSANLCTSSSLVTNKLIENTHDLDSDPSFENRDKYKNKIERTRSLLAGMLGANADEIALTRNTSESSRAIIGGLTLGKGDEVLLWDQNHESNNVAWDVWSKRLGFTVKRVTTPLAPRNSDELLKCFVDAIGQQTKVVAFSQVSNISGIALPAKEICRAAKKMCALSLVDGAQTFGVIEQNLHQLGCDFYVGSAHK